MEQFELYERYPELSVCREQIEKLVELTVETARSGGTVYVAGNGGSACDCEHIVGELMKNFLIDRKPASEGKNLQRGIRAVSLPSQIGIFTAFSNDVCFESVYAQLLGAYARENDLFIGISTSGNSESIIRAFDEANRLGIKSAALVGAKPCRADSVCGCVVKVPQTETYKIQELHLPVYHYVCGRAEAILFGENN